MSLPKIVSTVILSLLLLCGLAMLFTVNEGESALVLRLGKIVSAGAGVDHLRARLTCESAIHRSCALL